MPKQRNKYKNRFIPYATREGYQKAELQYFQEQGYIPEYHLLITDWQDLTYEKIDEICNYVAHNGVFLDTACYLAHVAPQALMNLKNKSTHNIEKHKRKNELEPGEFKHFKYYAEDAVRQAQAKQEEILTQKLLEETPKGIDPKVVMDFMGRVNPRFQPKFKVEVERESTAMLLAARDVLSDEDYYNLLSRLEQMDQLNSAQIIDGMLQSGDAIDVEAESEKRLPEMEKPLTETKAEKQGSQNKDDNKEDT